MSVRSQGDPIAAFLAQPGERVDLAGLAGCFRHVVVRIACRRPAGFPVGPELPGRLRGAWGRQLLEGASDDVRRGQPCSWRPVCAQHVLFGDFGRPAHSHVDHPKPYVLAAEDAGDEVVVALTLFGLAADWVEPAADALVRALRGGIAGNAQTGGRRPALEPLGRDIHAVAGIALPAAGGRAVLDFASPVALRSGEAVKADLSALPMTLGARIEGLARWMGLAISADWQGLRHAAHAVALDQSALRVRTWNRRSDRQGGKVIPMIGLEGRLAITGQLAPILPLLALGAITHAGSHAAIGLGRYRLRIED